MALAGGVDNPSVEERWVHVEGKRGGRAYTASVRHPFDRTGWPEFEHHVAVAIDYAPHWRTGLPKGRELTRLQDLEDRMIEQLEGHGVLVASETTDATRTVHLFIRDGGPLIEMYRDWQRRGKQGGLAVTVVHDPQWQTVAYLAQVAARAS
jgi:hypothetical protein